MSAPLANKGLVWISASNGETVDGAIVAGSAEDGNELHIARAEVREEVAVGKVHIGHDHAYIPSYGKEETVAEYEVLSNRGDVDLEWVAASGDQIPTGAVVGGTDGEGLPIYAVRCPHENDVVPGKLIISKGKAYIPWGGEEHAYDDYEILCVKSVTPKSD